MSTTLFSIAIVACLLCMVTSRFLNERAFRLLNDKQKVQIMDAFSRMRAYSLVPLVLVIGVMLGLPYVAPAIPSIHQWSLLIGLLLMLIYMIAIHVMVARKLATLELPSEYTRRFLISRHISHTGVFILFAVLMFGL